MPNFADIDNLIASCRTAHGISEEDLMYDWPLSDNKKKRLAPYLEGINDEQIGTEDGTVSLFRSFNRALHRAVEAGKVNKTADVIADILYWGGINGNKRKKLESYARQLHIVGNLPDSGQKVALEEFYYR